jgi:hypothetical protein
VISSRLICALIIGVMACPGITNTDIGEAADYVDSIMSSQIVTRVSTPVTKGRKRNASEPSIVDTDHKKARVTTKAKRSLIPSTVMTSSNANSSYCPEEEPSLMQLFAQLSADINMQFCAMNERMDKLESGLEQRISNKVAQLLDKRVNSEMTKISRKVEADIVSLREDLKADLADELSEMNCKIQNISSGGNSVLVQPDLSLNVVIKDLSESPNENTKSKVNSLIRTGLKIADVSCVKAERKKSSNVNKPGLIIATFSSHEDKRKVMANKTSLLSSGQFKDVYISHDQTHAERTMANNFRVILGSLKQHGLVLRGSRIVRKDDVRSRNQRNERDCDRRSPRGNDRRDNRDDGVRLDSRRDNDNNRPVNRRDNNIDRRDNRRVNGNGSDGRYGGTHERNDRRVNGGGRRHGEGYNRC